MPLAGAVMASAAFTLAFFVANTNADDFLSASDVSMDEVEFDLMVELSNAGASLANVDSLEAALQPMYTSLPKDENGLLPHTAVRYALHRLLVHQHGWYVKGLEPDGVARGDASPDKLVREWVPSHLQRVLEARLGRGGLDLHELAVIAATLEDVARREAVGRVQAIYDLLKLDTSKPLMPEKTQDVIDMYVLVYLRGGKFDPINAEDALWRLANFREHFRTWSALRQWTSSLVRNITDEPRNFDFATTKRIAEEFGELYAFYDERECRELKRVLVSIEEQRPGRVRLADFYAKGIAGQSTFQFTERIDWLRAMGALDESEPSQPSVIIPNYVISRPQCLEASSVYAVCCRNECEDLMAHLEERIGNATATPSRVTELVGALPSMTVTKVPRELPGRLVERLWQVARVHDGVVPLHGRLFAQWMHHAFPRECPFPHEAGTTSPTTPDEWMRENGEATTQATEEEMQCHVSGPCSQALGVQINSTDLPWTDAEELLVAGGAAAAAAANHQLVGATADAADPAAAGGAPRAAAGRRTRSAAGGGQALLLRSLSQLGLLFGLASLAWRACSGATFRVAGFDDDEAAAAKGGTRRGLGERLRAALLLLSSAAGVAASAADAASDTGELI